MPHILPTPTSPPASTIGPVPARFRNRPLRRLLNVFVKPIVRLGLAGKRTHVLTVVGRRSGRRYSTPVSLVFLEGERWLVAPYGEREWVKNARAAGWVELSRALKTERVEIEEVGSEPAARVLRAYLRSTPVTAPFFDAKRSAPLEKFAEEAHRHPVFRLVTPA
jgi:deazaflavin-dependent oxidoreductase (nitroreductase family)